jgi:glycine/D-amino acid oxidase-like deaminating enzyme
MNDLFTPDFRTASYWWDRSQLDGGGDDPELPADCDVGIIGSGYTGLHAAIQTARAGLSTLVLDAEAAGSGCSTRNGGQISTSIKPSYPVLARRYGESLAAEILREGQASLDHIASFVREENIDCNFRVAGRFHGAHTPRAFDRFAAEIEAGHPVLETGAYLVSRAEQGSEIGTHVYHGGIVYPRHASVDPGRYHAGLLKVARVAGTRIVAYCPVAQIERRGGHFLLHTPRGILKARRVIVATNGYTGKLTPWLQRRIIPIGSYIIATEPIAPDLMNRLMPGDRVYTDSRKLVYYYRASPDRKRILFGGRVSLAEAEPRLTAPKLHAELVRLFPELKGTRISHSWGGTVGFSFDTLMHYGEQDGLHYAAGYCGSGVGMAGYLGMRIGRKVANPDETDTALGRIRFPSRPFYSGKPWFLAPSILAYRIRDYLDM